MYRPHPQLPSVRSAGVCSDHGNLHDNDRRTLICRHTAVDVTRSKQGRKALYVNDRGVPGSQHPVISPRVSVIVMPEWKQQHGVRSTLMLQYFDDSCLAMDKSLTAVAGTDLPSVVLRVVDVFQPATMDRQPGFT